MPPEVQQFRLASCQCTDADILAFRDRLWQLVGAEYAKSGLCHQALYLALLSCGYRAGDDMSSRLAGLGGNPAQIGQAAARLHNRAAEFHLIERQRKLAGGGRH